MGFMIILTSSGMWVGKGMVMTHPREIVSTGEVGIVVRERGKVMRTTL